MRPFLFSIAAALVLTLALPVMSSSPWAGTAHAQNKQNKDQKKKVKTYDFSGDTIDGELLRPDGDVVDTRRFANHTSLIRVRKDFIKEILKSAEDL